MKVLLKKDLETLGNAGDVRDVKDGYARNFLIPNGYAVLANDSNLKSFEEIKRQKKRKTDREIADANVIKSRIEVSPITIYVKTAEEGKIYGSVTSQMILDSLLEKGFENIERRKIIIPEHIKTIGEYTVDIKLHSNVVAKLKVLVEKEKSAEEKTENESAVNSEQENQ